MLWATVSSRSCFCWLSTAFPFQLQRMLSVWFQYWPFGDVHVWSCLLCCWKRVFAVTSPFSWHNSVSLCPASFCALRPNLLVTPGISWCPIFAFQSPTINRTFFFPVLVLGGLLGLHRMYHLHLLQHQSLEHRLVLLWCWMVCLRDEPRSFCHFWSCTQVPYFGLFVDYKGYSISSLGFFPIVVGIMVIWIKVTHSFPF